MGNFVKGMIFGGLISSTIIGANKSDWFNKRIWKRSIKGVKKWMQV